MDSISTSARVSSNTFINVRNQALDRRGKYGRPRGRKTHSTSDSAPPVPITDDSEADLTAPPNRISDEPPRRFRRQAPFSRASEAHSETRTRILMAAAPLSE